MPRRCRQCREYCIPKDAPKSQFVCGVECSIAYGKAHAKKVQEKAWKQHKKERADKVRNFRMSDRAHQLKLTQEAVNKLVKLLDKDAPCIVHGRYDCADGRWDAGHFLTRAAHPELRFDLRNIFKQCRGSNVAVQWRGKGKNTEASIRQQFEAGIIQRYGPNLLDWLKGPHAVAKWTVEDLTAIRLEANAEVRRLEAGQGPSRNWREIPQAQEQAA